MNSNYNVYIKAISSAFGEDNPFTLKGLLEVGGEYGITPSLAYLRNIAGNLVKEGAIKKYGRDKYILTEKKVFIPDISRKEILINADINKNLPYSSTCIWNLSIINNLAQHLINTDTVIVESELDSVDSVHSLLGEKYRNVYYSTDRNENAYGMKGLVIIKKSTSQAPIQNVGKVTTTTIEKLLVDLFTDKFFEPFQGYEIENIYNNAFASYVVNLEKLYRYAGRHGKKEDIRQLIRGLGYDRQ